MAEAFITRRGGSGGNVKWGSINGTGKDSITVPDLVGANGFSFFWDYDGYQSFSPSTAIIAVFYDGTSLWGNYMCGEYFYGNSEYDEYFSFDASTGTISCSWSSRRFVSNTKYTYAVW